MNHNEWTLLINPYLWVFVFVIGIGCVIINSITNEPLTGTLKHTEWWVV